MTVLAAPPAEPATRPAPSERPLDLLEVLEHAAVLVSLLVWGIWATHADGGTTAHAVLWMAMGQVPALVLTRPWQRLNGWVVALCASLPVASTLVCVLAPTAWTHADTAASYGIAGAAAASSMAWVAGGGRLGQRLRHQVLAIAVVAIGLEQITQGLLEWWGAGDPSRAMSGTLGWRNQFAAFLVAPVLLGVAAVVSRTRPAAIAGWVAAPLGAACVVFASSRATLALLGLGWATVGIVLVLRSEERRQAALRLVGLSVAAAVVTFALPGQPLFDHRVSPFSATSARSSGGETLSANGGFRLEFWREAAEVGLHHPVSGGGYGSLSSAAGAYVPGSFKISSQAHDGFLQAFSDGGLLLGVPVLAASGLLALGALGRVRRRRDRPADPLVVGGAVAIVVLLAHSALDFDWSRPVVMVVPALLAGVCGLGRRTSSTRRIALPVALVALTAALPLLASGVKVHADAALADSLTASDRAVALSHLAGSAFADDRAAEALLSLPGLTDSQVQLALDTTAGVARVDTRIALQRALVQHERGLDPSQVDAAFERGLALARKRVATMITLVPLAEALGRQAEVRGPLLAGLLAFGTDSDKAELDALLSQVQTVSGPETAACAAVALKAFPTTPVPSAARCLALLGATS